MKITENFKQKAVLIILILSMILMFVIPVFSQEKTIPTDNIVFETIQTETYFRGEGTTSLKRTLIEFRGNYIIMDGNDQTRKLILEGDWRDYIIKPGDPISLKADALDHGGFKCLLNFGYEKKVDKYFLWISYRNVQICHWLEPSDKEMWDTWDEWSTSSGHHIPKHIDYSPEELQVFFSNFGFLFGDFASLSWLE